MHILLFFSGFLPKGSQRLACQLLNCLFAANTQGINYSFIKILLSLFFTALGLKLTTLHIYATIPPDVRSLFEHYFNHTGVFFLFCIRLAKLVELGKFNWIWSSMGSLV